MDLSKVPAVGERITRQDVERFIGSQKSVGRVAVAATPAARRVARESGVALETVAGSGPRGRVQSTDVLATAKPVPTAAKVQGRDAEVVSLTSIRRTIAERMQQSFQELPHIALTVDIDATELEGLRKRFNIQAEKLGQPRVHSDGPDDQNCGMGAHTKSLP